MAIVEKGHDLVGQGQVVSTAVHAWACSQCEQVHREKVDADACCTCTACGAKFKREGYRALCASCSWGSHLRSARDEVERSRVTFNNARDRLERLLTSERPPDKRKPKDDVVPPRDESYVHPDGTQDKSAWAPLYAARDWLRELAASLDGQTEIADEAREMADRVTYSIKKTGGGAR